MKSQIFSYERTLIDYQKSEQIDLRNTVDIKKGSKALKFRKDEYGVAVKGYPDYVITNYGKLFKWTETRRLSKQAGSVFKNTGKRQYSLTRYDTDGKPERHTMTAEKLVSEAFIECNIPRDKAGNYCIWTVGNKVKDDFAGHLYPCDRAQIEALHYLSKQGIVATEDKIIEVIEGAKYYAPTFYDVGYLGEAGYLLGNTIPYDSPCFKGWCNMLKRCYWNPKKAYSDVTVCEEWLNFSNYYYWRIENNYELDGEDLQLDKDILIPGNRIYTPDACLLVPASVNLLFRRNNAKLTSAAIRRYIDMYRGLVPEKVIAAMSSWVERLEAEKSKVAAAE